MSDNNSLVIGALRRLSSRYDTAGDQMTDFLRRQTEGEEPDPDEFTKLLEHRSVTSDAMSAQFKLIEKPIKTVLQESK